MADKITLKNAVDWLKQTVEGQPLAEIALETVLGERESLDPTHEEKLILTCDAEDDE